MAGDAAWGPDVRREFDEKLGETIRRLHREGKLNGGAGTKAIEESNAALGLALSLAECAKLGRLIEVEARLGKRVDEIKRLANKVLEELG